jgi:hypothetical protein
MAHKHSTLEQPDAQFVAFAGVINEQSTTHSAEWQLDPMQVSELQMLVSNANTTYADNINPSTKNHLTAVAKKYAFGALKNFLGTYINFLEGNLHVPDAALEVMGLRPRVRHASQPIDRPTDQPVIHVKRQHDELTVYVSRAEDNHPTSTVGPFNFYGFKIRHRFEDETENKTVISTRLHHTLFFERADEGRRVIISAAFVNPRLQEGPWSDDISEIIG